MDTISEATRLWNQPFVLLRARARITWHFAAGPQARWRNASDELYARWYVRSEQQSQRACGPQPERARWRVGICFVAVPRRRTPTSPAPRRLASAHPALAPKCQLILARALRYIAFFARNLCALGVLGIFVVSFKKTSSPRTPGKLVAAMPLQGNRNLSLRATFSGMQQSVKDKFELSDGFLTIEL